MSTLLESIMLRILAESTDPENAKSGVTAILENQGIKRLMQMYVSKCVEIFNQNFPTPADLDTSTLESEFIPMIEESDRLNSIRRAILTVAERLLSRHMADPEETEAMMGAFTESLLNVPGSMILGAHYDAIKSPDDVEGILHDRMYFFVAQISYNELDDPSFFDEVQPILDQMYPYEG